MRDSMGGFPSITYYYGIICSSLVNTYVQSLSRLNSKSHSCVLGGVRITVTFASRQTPNGGGVCE